MNCCGSHNHDSKKNAEGNILEHEQHSSGGHRGLRWMQFILLAGLLAYVVIQFIRR